MEYWPEIQSGFADKDIEVERFLAGDGSLDVQYDLIDMKTNPPIYTNSSTYPSWINKHNAYNCWRCHHQILERYKADNINLFLLEDDVFIEDDFDDVLAEVSPWFENHLSNWDMIYFGGYHRKDTVQDTNHPNIFRVNGSAGYHGVLMRPNVIKELVTFAPIGPMDWITGKYIHPKYNCYAIFPSILSQRDNCYSHVEGSVLEKPARDKIL